MSKKKTQTKGERKEKSTPAPKLKLAEADTTPEGKAEQEAAQKLQQLRVAVMVIKQTLYPEDETLAPSLPGRRAWENVDQAWLLVQNAVVATLPQPDTKGKS